MLVPAVSIVAVCSLTTMYSARGMTCMAKALGRRRRMREPVRRSTRTLRSAPARFTPVRCARGATSRCWGNNDYGQSTPPGNNDELLAEDPGVGDFIAVSAGGLHTCGLRQGGTVVCWGDNSYGQAPSWPR